MIAFVRLFLHRQAMVQLPHSIPSLGLGSPQGRVNTPVGVACPEDDGSDLVGEQKQDRADTTLLHKPFRLV